MYDYAAKQQKALKEIVGKTGNEIGISSRQYSKVNEV